MRFICAACGKTLDLQGEEARFCPFCGRAYAAAVMEGARADAVQAKYWQMTRAAYGAALRDMADFQGRQSPKKGFRLERLTGASSKNQARQEIERCLAMLAKQLDAPKETEQRAPADAIDTFGRQLARILGGEIPESAPPKEDEKPEEKKNQIFHFTFTVTTAFFLPERTVIFTVPAFLPVMTPFFDTFAIRVFALL